MKYVTIAAIAIAAVGVEIVALTTIGATVESAQAHANGPVCHADFDHVPQSVGLHVVSFARIDCTQQPDSLRYVIQLQHLSGGQTFWSTDDQSDGEATLPLHQIHPLSGKCVPGRWRVMAELWERTAGQPWHGVYLSDESLLRTFDCTEPVG